MKLAWLLVALLPNAALAVTPASPASCKMISKSKLGDHLRETAWDLARARTRLNRDLSEHNHRCQAVRGELSETRQLTEIERIGADIRRVNAELLGIADEYTRTLRTAASAAHLLQEEDCEQHLLEQRRDVDVALNREAKEISAVLEKYCR
jgi:hypothetical protein